MTTFDTISTRAKQLLAAPSMPRIRIAVPALRRSARCGPAKTAQDRLARDELMQLFQSDLEDMKSLKPAQNKSRPEKNVICLRSSRLAALAGMTRAA